MRSAEDAGIPNLIIRHPELVEGSVPLVSLILAWSLERMKVNDKLEKLLFKVGQFIGADGNLSIFDGERE